MILGVQTGQDGIFQDMLEILVSILNYSDLELVGELAIGLFVGLAFGFLLIKLGKKYNSR
jgi:hypothetical protein